MAMFFYKVQKNNLPKLVCAASGLKGQHNIFNEKSTTCFYMLLKTNPFLAPMRYVPIAPQSFTPLFSLIHHFHICISANLHIREAFLHLQILSNKERIYDT